MRPVRLALLAALVGGLALGACGGDGDDTPRAAPTTASTSAATAQDGSTTTTPTVVEAEYTGGDGARVAVLGDSITVQSLPALRSALPDVAIRAAAVRGEGFATGPYSATWGVAVMPYSAGELGATEPDIAVVALGTNDAWRPDGALADALAALDQIVADMGDACLVVVLVDDASPAPELDEAAAQEINARLEAVADEVVDWGAVAREPGVLTADGIHPTPAGQDRWAEEVAAAVEACPT